MPQLFRKKTIKTVYNELLSRSLLPFIGPTWVSEFESSKAYLPGCDLFIISGSYKMCYKVQRIFEKIHSRYMY